MTVVSKDLIFRMRRAECVHTAHRLAVWQSVEGNPMQASVRQTSWGSIFHFAARPTNSVFNRAVATEPGIFEHLDEIEAAFAKTGAPPYLEIGVADLSGDFKEESMAKILKRGYAVHGVEGIYFGETSRDYKRASDDIEAVAVTTDKQKQDFTQTYLAGWETPSETSRLWHSVADAMFDCPEFSGYLALVDGKPAGAAQLHIHDGIGYYADACVRPEFRRRGCQRALFNARLDASRKAGCELIFSIAEFADQSANNMEAFGLRMATEIWHWVKHES